MSCALYLEFCGNSLGCNGFKGARVRQN